jgi:hypothetical protein
MSDERLFEFYKLMVEEAREARAARRGLANTFMTLNLAGVGALGFLAKGEAGDRLPDILLIWCAMALIFVCLIWSISSNYYTKILGAKFVVINDFETRLSEKPLKHEWDELNRRGRAMRFFTLERAMPFLFILGYGVFLLYATSLPDILAGLGQAGLQLRTMLGL